MRSKAMQKYYMRQTVLGGLIQSPWPKRIATLTSKFLPITE